MNTLRRSNFGLITLIVIILSIGLILFLITQQDDDISSDGTAEHALVIPEVNVGQEVPILDREAQTVAVSDDVIPSFEEETVLPKLSESDTEFTQALLGVSAELQSFLFKNELIKKIVFTINDISQGGRPSPKILRELALAKPFSIRKTGGKMYVASKSYQRYEPLAQAVSSIDSQVAVAVYKKYLPLMQTVFDQFSYPPSYQVSDIIKGAAGKVIQAPVITKRIEVVRPSVHYKFADAKLERLSALDKQMLRMGPDNTRMIQDKLRELMQVLLEAE